jgi:hypothetical protein
MGKDNQPKDRQKARDLRRRAAVRQPVEDRLKLTQGNRLKLTHP